MLRCRYGFSLFRVAAAAAMPLFSALYMSLPISCRRRDMRQEEAVAGGAEGGKEAAGGQEGGKR